MKRCPWKIVTTYERVTEKMKADAKRESFGPCCEEECPAYLDASQWCAFIPKVEENEQSNTKSA
jgi:hypothetical protein